MENFKIMLRQGLSIIRSH